MMEKAVLPFLKWPGGKRWLAPQLTKLIRPHLSGTYFEPFLGGGAVFFSLKPERAILSDINEALVNVYTQVQANHEAVIKRLRGMSVSAHNYKKIRDLQTSNMIQRATNFLYLNRTAWGGIYRLNSSGRFNVPFGGGERTPEPLWKNHLLLRAAKVLEMSSIVVSDFDPLLERANKGEVVYYDPTYTVAHNCKGWITYNEKNFSWADQKRLANACKKAAKRGSRVIVTNACHTSIRQLYPDAKVRILNRKSLVSASPFKRGDVDEYLFVLD